MKVVTQIIKREFSAKVATFIFVIFTVFWLSLFLGTTDDFYHGLYGSTYGILAAWGGVMGIIYCSRWGGIKSVMGRVMLSFAIGLLLQFFGQVAYTVYIYVLHVDLPYPSIGDIGYFGSIPFYIYGVLMLAKASGVKLSRKSYRHKLMAFAIPVVLLVISYFFLLRGYVFDWSTPLVIFLDFGYPLGQAIYISLAILVYLLSMGTLGGLMKSKILFFIFALFVQYLSDFSFIYLVKNDLWFVGGINDYIYLVSYFVMTLALIQLKTVYDDLTGKTTKN